MGLFSKRQTSASAAAVLPTAPAVPVVRDAFGREVAGAVLPPIGERVEVVRNGERVAMWNDPTAYRCPGGAVSPFFTDLLSADGGVLISGATGSGKSVLLGGIITAILRSFCPSGSDKGKSCSMYLCDPKIVEFQRFRAAPHVVGYAESYDGIMNTLDDIDRLMMERYETMKHKGLRKWDGERVFVFIDEIGDLMLTRRAEFLPRLTHILNLCRASGITVFCASQSPSRLTIPAQVQLNCTVKIALRCDTAIESRQVVGEPGAETLPRYGFCLLKRPGSAIAKSELPYVTDEEIADTLKAVYKAKLEMLRSAVIG